MRFGWLWIVGCAGPHDPVDTAALDAPWDAPGFWTEPGPLAPLVAPDAEDPALLWTVRMATSADGITWEAQPGAVLGNVNSLDMYITDDGLILMGLVSGTPDVYAETGVLYALATTDLQTWASHAWSVEGAAHQNMVDPSLHLRADGRLGLTYYGCPEFFVDPVTVAGDHDLYRAVYNGHNWTEEEAPAYAAEGLVDPVICTLQGKEWLFATQGAARIVSAEGQPDGRFTEAPFSLEGDTVPYCRADGDALALYSQTDGSLGVPHVARFDGLTLGDSAPVYPEHLWGVNNCSSPVMGWFQDQYVLFCAVDMPSYRSWLEHR